MNEELKAQLREFGVDNIDKCSDFNLDFVAVKLSEVMKEATLLQVSLLEQQVAFSATLSVLFKR